MRISDWSSDVCSSDLRCFPALVLGRKNQEHEQRRRKENGERRRGLCFLLVRQIGPFIRNPVGQYLVSHMFHAPPGLHGRAAGGRSTPLFSDGDKVIGRKPLRFAPSLAPPSTTEIPEGRPVR